MSAVTKMIGLAKKCKHRFQDTIQAHTRVYLSPVRRIERVALEERVCAMTFDDGPCRLPTNPDKTGLPLTLLLAQTLEQYGAKGTFDVVGDTSQNYPDTAGKPGSAEWGGVRYDHYPDFQKDADGGVKNCPELVKRLLDGGHEVTSHTYRHVLFGAKPLVYGKRKPFSGLDEVVQDLKRLDELMQNEYGYRIRLSRPPHYVDQTKDGFSSYDAYALMGYQYMAASFDGAGWLPLASYEQEVRAMVQPFERALAENPGCFCGQIIFQKDGYNMARRSPVADALAQQLALLQKHGYRVVTVSELLEKSPFRDLSPHDALFADARALLRGGWCICFRDNCVKPEQTLTRAELAMYRYGVTRAAERIALVRGKTRVCRDVGCRHPYAAAIQAAVQNGSMQAKNGRFRPDDAVTAAEFAAFCRAELGAEPKLADAAITHAAAIAAIAQLLATGK